MLTGLEVQVEEVLSTEIKRGGPLRVMALFTTTANEAIDVLIGSCKRKYKLRSDSSEEH